MINETKLLSIIVSAYNTEKQLAHCLDSILRQTYKNIEVIIVNDGSSDGTDRIIQRYLAVDKRLRYVEHASNRGLFQARISGFEAAHGDYVAFVDSDDYVSIDYYRPMMQKAIESSLDIVANDTVRVSDNGDKNVMPLHLRSLGENLLLGEDVRKKFYGQCGYCYSWHTIWNKIYSRIVWEQALPYYKKIQQHLVMTEDIAFSCILFYFAKSFIHISDGEYFYCENSSASTNIGNIDISKFKKNISDLLTTFNFVSDFLVDINSDEYIKRCFLSFRKHYYMMYKKTLSELPFARSEYNQCLKLLNELFDNGNDVCRSSYSVPIDDIKSKWYDSLEKIKEQIVSTNSLIISFDIFDTLLIRPVWKPEDIFEIMENEITLPSGISVRKFKELRIMAEKIARLDHIKDGIEDVTIDEIYISLSDISCYSHADCLYLKKYEISLEKKLLFPRNTGLCLFNLARHTGKDIILISDMYLPKNIIEDVLKNCGIIEYKKIFVSSETRRLKSTGSIFRYVADMLKTEPNRILHIGDNWNNDILKSRACGYQTAFLPKSVDRFCNQISGMPTNCCSTLPCIVGNHLTTWDALYSSLGFRTMQSLIAHKIFDDPYRNWNENSDLNVDPFIAGYYAGGMYLFAISAWLVKICKKYDSTNICFLARDGFLPIKVFCRLKEILNADDINFSYVSCSRRTLLPAMVETEEDLFALPVSWKSHSPESMAEMLQFCSEKNVAEIKKELVEEFPFWNQVFQSGEEFCRFVKAFSANLFSSDKLSHEQHLLKEYYQARIPEKSVVFDLGYSGRMINALSKLTENAVYAYALHDNDCIFANAINKNIKVEFMTHITSSYSNLIREYFLSDITNSCIRIDVSDEGQPEAIILNEEISYCRRFPRDLFEEGAMNFIEDYLHYFSDYKIYGDEVVMTFPFEGMIHAVSNEDRRMLMGTCSDDFVFANVQNIDMSRFWTEQTDRNIIGGRIAYSSGKLNIYNLIWGRSTPVKIILCLLCDWTPIKKTVKEKLQHYPYIEIFVKKAYYGLRRIYWRLRHV